jgi:hypothetical protein
VRWRISLGRDKGEEQFEQPEPVKETGPGRRQKRRFLNSYRHRPEHTSGNVVFDQGQLTPDQERVREERLRKRRGKSKRWTQKRKKTAAARRLRQAQVQQTALKMHLAARALSQKKPD